MDDTEDELKQHEIDQNYVLEKTNELRIECSGTAEVIIRLEDGTAEIFGAEMQRGVPVNIAGQKLAVFTWTGCKVHVKGKPDLIYTADDTPMVSYMNTHSVMNNQRQEALKNGKRGPNCILLGPTDSGKSTICKMLCNWAVRSGWEPTMVDLDIGQGSITTPGCLAATPIERPIEVEEGYPLDMPLVFFYGHASPSDNPDLYRFLVDRLSSILQKRAEASPKAAASGLIINTFGWVDGLGYELQVHAISSLKADLILVMEQDRLMAEVSKTFHSQQSISIVKLGKSGGVVKREREERTAARNRRIREYFYGTSLSPLTPVTLTARSDSLTVYRIGGGPRAPNSTLPIGQSSVADPLRLTHVPAGSELTQCLLAVTHAPSADLILSTNVAGFVLIKDIDSARGMVTYLSPCPGALPGRPYLVTGSIRSSID